MDEENRKKRGWLMIAIGLIILGLFIAPLAIPVPPVEGTLPTAKLADPDSKFADIGGVKVHYKTAGKGEPVFLLLHGFGASLYSWRKVMPELAKYGTVVAFDRLGFGLTERLLPGNWTNGNPYSMQKQIGYAFGLLDSLGYSNAVWVGHSAGGTVAVTAAGTYPGKIKALILVDPAIISSGPPGFAQLIYSIPSVNHIAPLLMRNIKNWGMEILASAWFDTNKITEEDIALYRKPLSMSNWDIGLWEFTKATGGNSSKDYLGKLGIPVLLVTGDHDEIVPPSETVSLTNLIPSAELAVISNCGHIPHEEQSEAFLREAIKFIKKLKTK
ncbi:MAG: hypothetical protein A2Y33_15950 [Spirochaetes bacterium GWF1_51_8]|nr:MAG: hypothetical protein A2Y33_15950 [Spirochaetes bacterium GWF1_51_8]